MQEILSKIGFDWHVALANLINFLIILFVLKKYAWGPIGKMIAERNKNIKDGLENAKLNAEKLKETKTEYEETIRKAHLEAQAIFAKGKKESELKKIEMMEDAKKETAKILASGRASLEEEKRKMLEDAKKELVDLVASATEKVLTKGITNQIDNMLIEQSVKELR